jgi:ankyrin repeat protein
MMRSATTAVLCLSFFIPGCGRSRPALVVAATHGNLPLVKVLLHSAADPNVCHAPEGVSLTSPLAAAAANGHRAVVDELLRNGASVDQICGGDTALGFAVSNGHVEVVKRLLAGGADAKLRNEAGWTYLMQATIAVQAEVIPLLVQAGCPLEAKRRGVPESIDDTEGQTALMIAAAWDPRPTKALIVAGADVNARDATGATPLVHAVKGAISRAQSGPTKPGEWDPSIVGYLLDAGADPNVVDMHGQTPYELSARTGTHAATIRLMLSRARPDRKKSDCRLTTHRSWWRAVRRSRG